jgi:esterase/lipase
MKKKILYSLLILILLFIISIPFTKYKILENIKSSDLPTELTSLDSYLESKESSFKNLTKGTEKKILWHKNSKQQTEFSLLYFPGFSATAPEMDPLLPLLAESLEANIYFARLKGHGLSGEEFAEASGNDWLNDAVESYKISTLIGKKVIIVGSSTGCLLGLWLATKEEYKKNISTLVLLSSNFHPASALSELVLYPAGIGFIKLIYGKEREWKPQNEQVAKYWNHKYPWEGLIPMMTLVDYSAEFPYSKMDTPLLMLYTDKDEVVDLNKIKSTYEIYGSKKKKLIMIKEAVNHVMAGDILSPNSTKPIVNEVVQFLKEFEIKK